MPLTVLSLMGLLAVTGVVVNDSLVLVAFINDYRKEGHSLGYAATVGAVRRFRPILLTSLTTFFGLAPMLMETSLQARFLVPMAVSLAFGVAFATIFILTIVPCCYLIIEDLKGLLGQSSEVEQSPQNSVLEPVKA
jgi:multidrug efflux pump subunit AcrB